MRDSLRLPNGEIVYKVSKAEYRKSEKVRNYILRMRYERGTPTWLASYRAMSKYKVSESFVHRALYMWKTWYYGAGIRHRPIELFIEDEEKKKKEQ